MHTITVKTPPVPLNALYRCINSRSILSKRGREVKDALAWEIASQWRFAPLTGDVTLNIIYFFPDKRRRDIDAYLKVLLDAMNDRVYQDDCQVTELHVFKQIDQQQPRVIIQIL